MFNLQESLKYQHNIQSCETKTNHSIIFKNKAKIESCVPKRSYQELYHKKLEVIFDRINHILPLEIRVANLHCDFSKIPKD